MKLYKYLDYVKLFDGMEFDFKIYGELVHSYFQGTMSQHLKETNSDKPVNFITLLNKIEENLCSSEEEINVKL